MRLWPTLALASKQWPVIWDAKSKANQERTAQSLRAFMGSEAVVHTAQ